MTSYRIQRYGRAAAVQGDMVVDRSASAHEYNGEAAGNVSGADLDSCGDENSGVRRDHVRCLTNHEQEKHSLKDVVLPLPGYSVQYPTNDVGEA